MKRYVIVSMGGISSVGGVERVMYYLCEILKENNQVIIIDKKKIDNKYKIAKYINDDNIMMYSILSCIYVKKIRQKNDVIIGNGYNLPFVKKDFLFAHGNIFSFCKKVYNFSNYKLGLLEKISGMTSRNILAVSCQTKNEWLKYYNIKKEITVINNVVDCNIFYPIEKKDKKDFTILFCGRLEKAKGYLQLLELARYIEKKCNIRLIMAIPTECEEMDAFKDFKQTDIYIGKKIEEMNTFYNQGDVFYFPSEYEGFGLVIIESLAAGIPVVANKVGIMEELEKRQMAGVDIVTSTNSVQQVLDKMQTLHKKNQKMEQRNKIHNEIKDLYGIDAYKNKIKEIIVK